MQYVRNTLPYTNTKTLVSYIYPRPVPIYVGSKDHDSQCSYFKTGMCHDINSFMTHWESVIPTSIHAATDMNAGFKLLLDELWLAVIIMLGSLS